MVKSLPEGVRPRDYLAIPRAKQVDGDYGLLSGA